MPCVTWYTDGTYFVTWIYEDIDGGEWNILVTDLKTTVHYLDGKLLIDGETVDPKTYLPLMGLFSVYTKEHTDINRDELAKFLETYKTL